MEQKRKDRKITLKEWQDVLAIMNQYSRDAGWVENENLDKLTFFDSQPSTGGCYVTREDVKRYIKEMKCKLARVVMLPTQDWESTNIFKCIAPIPFGHNFEVGHIYMPHIKSIKGNWDYWQPQQLCFVANDEITAGDYFYEVVFNGKEFPAISKMIDPYYNKQEDIYKATGDKGVYTCSRAFLKGKVISATDPSLKLPSIPEAWMRDTYVPANGNIEQVLLKTVEESGDFTDSAESRMLHCINNEVIIVN